MADEVDLASIARHLANRFGYRVTESLSRRIVLRNANPHYAIALGLQRGRLTAHALGYQSRTASARDFPLEMEGSTFALHDDLDRLAGAFERRFLARLREALPAHEAAVREQERCDEAHQALIRRVAATLGAQPSPDERGHLPNLLAVGDVTVCVEPNGYLSVGWVTLPVEAAEDLRVLLERWWAVRTVEACEPPDPAAS